jgi:hypothetical protein
MTPWYVRDNVKSVYGDEVTIVEPHQAVWAFGEQLYNEQGPMRKARADAALFLYYGSARHGLRGSPLMDVIAPSDPPFRNVIQKCVDTKTAHIFQNKVRTYFTTDAAKVEERERAEGMTQAVEAQFAAAGFYDYPGYLTCIGGQLFEGGVSKVVADIENNRVLIDRVFPWEIFVPLEEARVGAPRQFFQRQLVDRGVLAAMFPKFTKQILAAKSVPDDWLALENATSSQTSDLVAVWEAWHLPSGAVDLSKPRSFGRDKNGEFRKDVDPGHDGRHVIALQDATLLDEPWPYDYPPFAFFKPQPDPVGFWSRSLPESLSGIQLELIKLGKRIQSLIHLHAVPRIVVWRNAHINKAKITNDHADILESSAPPGQSIYYLTPQAVPAELFRREQELDEEALRQAGISELSAYAQKPAGVQHAPPMQHLADAESIRHTPAFRAWESYHVQAGTAVVDAFRLLAEHNPNFEIMFGDADNLRRIKWKDVDLGRGKYKYRAWPTNLLPSSPGARSERILQYKQMGIFTQEQATAAAMEGALDMKAIIGDQNAVERNVQKLLDRVEQEGLTDETMPSPFNDPKLCMRLSAQRINKLEADRAEDERIEGLRQFWQAAYREDLKMTADAVRASQGAAPGQAPPPQGAPAPAAPPPEGAPPVPAAA